MFAADQGVSEMNENEKWAFGDWWELLNKELDALNQEQAAYGEARYYYNANYSPMTAAKLISEEYVRSQRNFIT
jgi:hypothetical protein